MTQIAGKEAFRRGEKNLFHFFMTNGIVNGMKNETIQIDKAGRVVLPKPLREQFNLLPGDKLRLSVEGSGFRLEPTDAGGELVRKGTVLVFTGGFAEPITTAKVNEIIEEDREGRITEATGKLRKK
jgi:AbrB family looped-hinge helix DNA binding protein